MGTAGIIYDDDTNTTSDLLFLSFLFWSRTPKAHVDAGRKAYERSSRGRVGCFAREHLLGGKPFSSQLLE